MTELYIQLYLAFTKIGFLSFGGGYSMIPLIETEIINKGWITSTEFIDIIAIAEMTPGTVAANTATFTGFRIAGWPGSLIATLGIITPSIILLLFLGNLLLRIRNNQHGEAVLNGLRPAFISLIGMATVFMAQHSFIDIKSTGIGILLFLMIIIRNVNPFLIMAIGGLLGLLLYVP